MNAWSEKMEPSVMLFGGGGQLFRTESNYQFFFLRTLFARKLIHYIYPYRKLTRLPFVEATAGKRYELGTNQQAVGWRLGRVNFAHWRIENRVNKTKGKRSCRKTERWLWTGLYWKTTQKIIVNQYGAILILSCTMTVIHMPPERQFFIKRSDWGRTYAHVIST